VNLSFHYACCIFYNIIKRCAIEIVIASYVVIASEAK